ncbi:site-specific tyrosine recombinase XerD [Nanchangia anserum]|uniref:site-specific tyrosine recombinase XerD n=1 Tax=Nanchangia anserum TaxID=2692125 RepID=UPI001D115C7C|nr:site-specific tyrosine recombinase XerD [Nanchangia anserum]
MNAIEQACRRFGDHVALERQASAHTCAAYRRDLDRFCDYLKVEQITDLRDITPQIVESYLAACRTGADGRHSLAASSSARMLSSVRSFLAFSVDEGLIADNPAARVHRPKQDRRLPKALSLDDVNRLLAASSGEGAIDIRNRALLELLYGTGARISEAVALAVDDVDVHATQPIVRLMGKGRKERIVPLGTYACQALEHYLVRVRPDLAARGEGTPALFLNTRGRALSRQSAWGILRKVADAAGISQAVSPHTLRHSFATHMLEGGADVRVVQELLGHASVVTTQIYTQVTIQMLREVYATTHPRARG